MKWSERLKELIAFQQKKLLQVARRIEPGITEEDLWQPNDFPTLEMHPEFRYEEGVLHGLLAVEMALQADS